MKPEVFKVAITALCLTAQNPLADAATYYVSSSQGNDTNSGTSVDAPWKSLEKVYRKQYSANKFTAGDSILLKAGDSFDGPLKIMNSGSSGSPITINRYGAGSKPIIYGDNPSITWSAVAGHAGVYSASVMIGSEIEAVFDGNLSRYTQTNQGPDSLEVWLGKFLEKNWGFTWDTERIYVRTSDGNPPQQMRLFQYAAVEVVASHITIENLEIRNSEFGIVTAGASFVGIRSNSVQDTLGMSIYCGSGSSHAEIANNVVTRGGWTLIYLQTGGNHWVHNNTVSVATNVILGIVEPFRGSKELCGVGLERGTNNLVEHNTISYVKDSFVDYWLEVGSTLRNNYGLHAGAAAYPDGTGLRVHNNIFNVDGGRGIAGRHDHDPTQSPAPDAGDNLIYNNVILGFTSFGFYFGTNSSPRVKVRNNVFVATSTNENMVNVYTGIDLDYNAYYCTAGAPRGWYFNNTRYTSLAAFRAASGHETNGIHTDPQFVSANPVTAADFQLKATSPCINAGQDLTLMGLLPPTQEYQDYLGMLIPQGASPDIGAYETASPEPATNLRVVKP